MHDINPLGPMFHLKELERQAVPRLRQLRLRKHDASAITGLGALTATITGIVAFLGLASLWLV